MHILALCGSLRAASINAALLRTCARLAPQDMQISVWPGLADLPLFNPDLQAQTPGSVLALYQRVAAADALLIASPEYAHGVSGVIKNALDWLVSFEPFVNKPIAVLNASARARHADAALRETLVTMSANLVKPASITLPLLGSALTEETMALDTAVSGQIRAALSELRRAVSRGEPPATASFPVG